jgi:hypothetical protein
MSDESYCNPFIQTILFKLETEREMSNELIYGLLFRSSSINRVVAFNVQCQYLRISVSRSLKVIVLCVSGEIRGNP